jgi:RES domain-containing protein
VSQLPRDWKENETVTRAIGDDWLDQTRSLFLSVPCAIVPETENVLINPLHPDAKRLPKPRQLKYPFDRRLS